MCVFFWGGGVIGCPENVETAVVRQHQRLFHECCREVGLVRTSEKIQALVVGQSKSLPSCRFVLMWSSLEQLLNRTSYANVSCANVNCLVYIPSSRLGAFLAKDKKNKETRRAQSKCWLPHAPFSPA